ncbi:unnamed protein product [Orchesella dallaii]|uniref:Uncharacterized protein n=1 Tax=Orchesella dallaii TaxID=48710 RepID=A0ABP1REU6_9HEXA
MIVKMNTKSHQFLLTPSGIFRTLTVFCGFPGVTLTWFAFVSSTWTNLFPEVHTIITIDRNLDLNSLQADERGVNSSSESLEDFVEAFDLISDQNEEEWNKILFETLLFERIFIAVVTTALLISSIYLVIRIAKQSPPKSPCEVIFDFLFHVTAAFALVASSAMVLVAELKIETFLDEINDDLPSVVQEIIASETANVRSIRGKKIGAVVYGMANGMMYAFCVVTLRMLKPINKICKNRDVRRESNVSVISSVVSES